MTILMIDDDEDDQLFFSSALQEVEPAAKFMTAANGFKGLKYLKDTDTLPDFIFLDINMPMMDGKECLMQIKDDSRLAHIPVIMFSTSQPERQAELLIKAGADFYLQMPHDASIMPSLIRFIISGEYHKMKKFSHD